MPEPELIEAGADWIIENCTSLSVSHAGSDGELLLQLKAS
jgi:hypothetical protein